ncbi:MAG: hypothetical protein WA863_05115, partial [Methyloceanibacter sp.]
QHLETMGWGLVISRRLAVVVGPRYYDVAEKQTNTKNMDQFELQTDDLSRADIHEGRSHVR